MAAEEPILDPAMPSQPESATTRSHNDVYGSAIPYAQLPSQVPSEYLQSAASSQQSSIATFDVPTPKASQSPRPAVRIMPLSSQRADQNAPQSISSTQQNIANPVLSQQYNDSNASEVARPRTPRFSTESQHVQHRANNESSPSSGGSGSPTHGAKRTASGTIKEYSPPLPSPAKVRSQPGHSRNISLDSSASRISDLSSQLKTRLSYAMVKLQNGWEKRSIDEVENLASSQLGSPMSTTSTLRNGFPSPRGPVMHSANRTSRDLSSVTGTTKAAAISETPSPQRYKHAGYTSHGQHQHQQQQPRPIAPAPAPQPTSIPALAPAPDLTPTVGPQARNRRTYSHAHPKPTLPGVSTSASAQQKHRHHKGAAATASPNRGTPTPQEQDAVDTLLFMSSPANSGHFPPHISGSAQPSPLRTAFPRSSNSGGRVSALSSDSDEARAAKRRSLGVLGGLRSEGDVERILAQMGAEEGSSDDESGRDDEGLGPRTAGVVGVGLR